MNEEKITTSDNKKLSPEEIKRVKGLGCLQDKRYDDIFNIRVITGNGHITTDEHRAIADAADKFGNGQITWNPGGMLRGWAVRDSYGLRYESVFSAKWNFAGLYF